MPCTNQKTYNPINPGSKPPSPLSLWRAGQRRSSDNAEPNPPSRPQAKQRCESTGGWGPTPPGGRPGGRPRGCRPQRPGCWAAPGRSPRRRPLRRGVLAAKARVQGRALPPAAQAGVEFSKKGFTNALLYGMMLSAFECSQRNPLLRPLGTGRVQHAASPARNAAFGRFNYSLL